MGSFIFRWPYDANEVFVTGTFDDWSKTVKLDKKDGIFEKEVQLSTTNDKIQYKFVVDGNWTTDENAPQEVDEHNNVNNILLPENIKQSTHEDVTKPTDQNPAVAAMSGVTPESTTVALAAEVPKESDKQVNNTDAHAAISSSATPEATTAELTKDVPLEQKANLPGAFPETPAKEPEQQFSVSPIPASSGTSNPIQLAPGESVPHPSTFNEATVESTVRTDDAGYEGDASAHAIPGAITADGSVSRPDAFAVPPVSKDMIPESSLPMGDSQQVTGPGLTIQSVTPVSTTAALAAAVPLESQKQSSNEAPVSEVPEMVRDSMDKAHEAPEAAASKEAVEEKKEFEEELRQTVPESPAQEDVSATVGEVPDPVKKSITEAHEAPEAAASHEAVKEKKEMEAELKNIVQEENSAGAPAPSVAAATSATAPTSTALPDSTQISPTSTPPPGSARPTVTTGVVEAATAEVSGPPQQTKSVEPAATSGQSSGNTTAKGQGGTESKDKKKRHSGFFSKLKERFK